ncbi:MAG: dTMP kinase [Salinisphaera sp.]|nr:dTMP kinase [Salinisphaera sp.]
MSKGRFITLEGTEGAGKSSAVDALCKAIADAGHAVIATREPGGTGLGEAIRGVLLADHGAAMPAMSELLLMFAARAAHLQQRIEPARAQGQWVGCDRFTDASYAYQGAARGLGDAAVATVERLVQRGRQPDRVFWFDLPVSVGLSRAQARGSGNRFDAETLAFHETVRAAYQARAQADPRRVRRIDASAAPAQVTAQLAAALADLL